ncbi:hypothetical protein UlMin_034995 [Ulmus minor]
MATTAREARRRKIVERGSDRLALITGRIQTLPASSPLPTSSDLHPQTQDTIPLSQPFASHHEDYESHVTGKSTAPSQEDKGYSPVLPEDNPSTDAGPTIDNFDGSNQVAPLNKFEPNLEALRAPASDDSIARASLVSSTDQSSSVSALAAENRLGRTQKFGSFSPNQISTALGATERTRIFCSLAIALVVILSHIGFPLLGSKMVKGVLSFRPLYLVLLTNVTVVLAKLLDKQRVSGRTDRPENQTPPADGNDWATQLGKTLEIGFLMKKMIDAVFMDCAVYAILAVCGLSFAQLFY